MKRRDEVTLFEIERAMADWILRRVRPLVERAQFAGVVDPQPGIGVQEVALLSAYTQGLMDGAHPHRPGRDALRLRERRAPRGPEANEARPQGPRPAVVGRPRLRGRAAAREGSSLMPRFRKKPVVIEAEQFLPDKPWPEGVEPAQFQHNVPGDRNYWPAGAPVVQTDEGAMHVSPGDWIITGVKGERYPCKPDIFAATYEPVGP